MPIGKGFQENLRLDEGQDESGVRTILHWEGDEFTVEHQQDMEPSLKHVAEMRFRNSLRKRGEPMEVGHIPFLYQNEISKIPDQRDRYKAQVRFLKDNPAFCAYPGYL